MTKKVKNSIINRELTFPIKIGSHNITASPGDSVSSAFYYNKNFPYQNNVNKAIVTLQDKDIAAGICAKYIKESDACIL